jgi:hypothetical protein
VIAAIRRIIIMIIILRTLRSSPGSDLLRRDDTRGKGLPPSPFGRLAASGFKPASAFLAAGGQIESHLLNLVAFNFTRHGGGG